MVLALNSNIWFDTGSYACTNIFLTEISGVGKQVTHTAKGLREGIKSFQHGFEFCLVIAMVRKALGHYEHAFGIHTGLRIIRLFKAFSLGHDARFRIGQIDLVFI
jgi:hypothetical protein